ncbi:response regulator [Haliangium sp.]|uniref:response regulator n=1 Tax=Haliangium sp. TaxID=2663208 RepID=UPI003D12C83C
MIGGNPIEQALLMLESEIFGGDAAPQQTQSFEIAHAYQGEDAVEMVRREHDQGERFSVAFVDFRMPPGWNGVETTRRLWEIEPDLRIVICTAHADLRWSQVVEDLGGRDLHLLRKPFSPAEVRELAERLGRRSQPKPEAGDESSSCE